MPQATPALIAVILLGAAFVSDARYGQACGREGARCAGSFKGNPIFCQQTPLITVASCTPSPKSGSPCGGFAAINAPLFKTDRYTTNLCTPKYGVANLNRAFDLFPRKGRRLLQAPTNFTNPYNRLVCGTSWADAKARAQADHTYDCSRPLINDCAARFGQSAAGERWQCFDVDATDSLVCTASTGGPQQAPPSICAEQSYCDIQFYFTSCSPEPKVQTCLEGQVKSVLTGFAESAYYVSYTDPSLELDLTTYLPVSTTELICGGHPTFAVRQTISSDGNGFFCRVDLKTRDGLTPPEVNYNQSVCYQKTHMWTGTLYPQVEDDYVFQLLADEYANLYIGEPGSAYLGPPLITYGNVGDFNYVHNPPLALGTKHLLAGKEYPFVFVLRDNWFPTTNVKVMWKGGAQKEFTADFSSLLTRSHPCVQCGEPGGTPCPGGVCYAPGNHVNCKGVCCACDLRYNTVDPKDPAHPCKPKPPTPSYGFLWQLRVIGETVAFGNKTCAKCMSFSVWDTTLRGLKVAGPVVATACYPDNAHLNFITPTGNIKGSLYALGQDSNQCLSAAGKPVYDAVPGKVPAIPARHVHCNYNDPAQQWKWVPAPPASTLEQTANVSAGKGWLLQDMSTPPLCLFALNLNDDMYAVPCDYAQSSPTGGRFEYVVYP